MGVEIGVGCVIVEYDGIYDLGVGFVVDIDWFVVFDGVVVDYGGWFECFV